jgi:hypothetical protein
MLRNFLFGNGKKIKPERKYALVLLFDLGSVSHLKIFPKSA